MASLRSCVQHVGESSTSGAIAHGNAFDSVNVRSPNPMTGKSKPKLPRVPITAKPTIPHKVKKGSKPKHPKREGDRELEIILERIDREEDMLSSLFEGRIPSDPNWGKFMPPTPGGEL